MELEQLKRELSEIKTKGDSISPTERAKYWASANMRKRELETLILKLETEQKQMAINAALMSDNLVDITIPDINKQEGSLHPITMVQREVEQTFASMGFIVEDGGHIATEFENFTAVNIGEHHPARDMQDTFWLSNGSVLRTHTSATQNRLLKTYGPEFAAIVPGLCYRNENLDASHEMAFFQVEGMMVGKDITIGNLLYFLKQALTTILRQDVEIRLRPYFFPYTEPSFEVDVSCIFCDEGCSVCKQTKWMEFCGSGMVHPNVLEMGGVDSTKYKGFAFGFGLTRLAMLKYGIDDIRVFNSGNLEALKI